MLSFLADGIPCAASLHFDDVTFNRALLPPALENNIFKLRSYPSSNTNKLVMRRTSDRIVKSFLPRSKIYYQRFVGKCLGKSRFYRTASLCKGLVCLSFL